MDVIISEPRKLAEGQAKAVILVDNFLELAVLEDRQSKGERFKIVSILEDAPPQVEAQKYADIRKRFNDELDYTIVSIEQAIKAEAEEMQKPEYPEGFQEPGLLDGDEKGGV